MCIAKVLQGLAEEGERRDGREGDFDAQLSRTKSGNGTALVRIWWCRRRTGPC